MVDLQILTMTISTLSTVHEESSLADSITFGRREPGKSDKSRAKRYNKVC